MCIKIELQPQTNVSRNFAFPLYYKHRKVAHRRVQWRGTTWEYLFIIYEMIDWLIDWLYRVLRRIGNISALNMHVSNEH